jgi:predicted DNA-binding transcriptional regulator
MNPYKLREIYKYLTRAKKTQPDLPDVFSASKAPIPAKTQNVQETEAVNQFVLRNPRKDMAGGGRIGFADGPPGKFTEKGVSGPRGGRPIPDHIVMADDRLALKQLQNKVDKLNRVNKLDDKGIKFKVVKTSSGNYGPQLSYLSKTYRDALKHEKTFGPLNKLIEEFNQFKKTDLFKNYSKAASYKAGGVKSSKKQLADIGSKKPEVFNYLLNNKNANIEEIGKELKIPQSSVRKNLQGLYTDIYKRIGDQGAAYLTEFNTNQLDSVHDSIKNAKVPLKDRVKNLVIDAYKGDENLKPILQKLDNFYVLQSEIKKTQYGKFFAANLDHVVPLNFLRELEKGVSPMDLIRVRPIPEFLNQRAFKAQFDRVLGQAYATKNKKALEAIVNLQSYLPQEFGGITPDGKIIDYGAKPFSLKTNLSQADFPEIYKRVFEFIKNPELQDTFKEAKVSFKSLASKEKQIMGSAKDFLKNLENKKFGRVADVIIKTANDNGLGEAVQKICMTKKAKKGGRMFLSTGSGCPAADQDPKGFLRSISDNPQLAKFFKSGPGRRAAALAARVTGNVINPTTLIGGEVAFVLGDGLNNFASGLPLDESFDRAFVFADFGQFEKNLMNKAKELGYDDNQLNLLQETININKLDNRRKKLEYGLDVKKQDPSGLTSDATMGFEDRLVNTNKNLDDSVNNYFGTLNKMGFDSRKATDQETGFTYLDNVFKKRTQDQLIKDFEDRKRQVDPTQTPFGDLISPVFDLGSYTQPLKFAADIFNPFTKDVPFLSERQQEAKKLREMSEEELDAYNKARGFTIEDIQQGTSPQIRPLMDYLGTDVTGQGFGSQFLAGGGIAKLAGVDQGPPPVKGPNSQGLLSLKNRVRNY